MELFYAHYPSLEKSFVRFVRSRRQNPLEPWLVVCASSFLSKRLSALLARENGAVANIRFLTGAALLSALDAEQGAALPVFPQDNLRDFLLKDILTERGMDRYPVSPGFVHALKASLRDLADSLADPDVLEEHLQTSSDTVLSQEAERFGWLVRVYRRFSEREAQVAGYRPYQEMFERALSGVEKSAFLRGFKQIVFYGFYDMTGRQLELVSRIYRAYPSAVFAPYTKHAAYRFAKKFFETNWLGNSPSAEEAEENDFGALGASGAFVFEAQGSAAAGNVRVVSAADPRGEVFFAAKEILRLMEKEGYHFGDIALIARSAASYQDEVRRVFRLNCIPLDASFSYPLHKFPLGIFCLNLFSLAARGFDKDTVLDVVSSPYFKPAQKYRWRTLAAASLVSRDLSQWKDLLPQTKNYDPDFVLWLETCATRLEALNTPRAWAEAAALARMLLAENTDESAFRGKDAEIYRAVCDKIDSLQTYASVRPLSRQGEMAEELADALNSLSFNAAENIRGGVTFTDAVRARGLQFKAVFLLGMNEKSFPQIVPEDPVFRDRYRYLLRDVLGYWVNQKLERADEERLLFFAAVTAAREQLYVLYARTGTDGKEAIPSVYLAELARAARLPWTADETTRVSGRISEQISSVLPEFLTPKELSFSIILQPESAHENYKRAGMLTDAVSQSLSSARALNETGEPNAFDGFVASGKEIFARTNDGAGFSPSALQEMASCPMKYFFDKGLNLEEKEESLSRRDLPPDKRGTAYHEILQDFYAELFRLGLTHNVFDSAAAAYLNRAVEGRYTKDSYQAFGIYPVVWELVLEEIRTQLADFVTEDLKNLGLFTPSYFEQEFTRLSVSGLPFKLRGVI
ncbi:MAG: PD-(D/E)XK nuclease family protein, partial [Candidatus Avelusimicrobium sp.]